MKIIGFILIFIAGGVCGYFARPLGWEEKEVRQKLSMQTVAQATGEKFKLAPLIQETCGVLVLTPTDEHTTLLKFIRKTSLRIAGEMSQPNSPARKKRRINEVSALFEDALRIQINQHPDFTCEFPKTKDGEVQRSGYPDLRIEHLPTGSIAYLDPKLFKEKSIKSSFRTFYFEPSEKKTKVTEDALHLLVGFPHDGKSQKWTFGKPHLVDLSNLTVKLKAEFSASNKDLYSRDKKK